MHDGVSRVETGKKHQNVSCTATPENQGKGVKRMKRGFLCKMHPAQQKVSCTETQNSGVSMSLIQLIIFGLTREIVVSVQDAR